ncbi:MAG: hypothetical protein M1272_02335 [Firmicutes bacterium]|nr:hypothetical protein [Bacillota bacterium]
MKNPRWLDGEALSRVLTPRLALGGIQRAVVGGHHLESIRWHFESGAGSALVMMADDPERALSLQKTLYVRTNQRPSLPGFVAVSDLERGTPLAFLDGAVFTGIRTAAIAAYATHAFAAARARQALLGAGFEALYHARALADLGGMEALTLWNRTSERAQALAARLREEPELQGVDIRVAADAAQAVSRADVVTTVTGSPLPVLAEDGLGETVLINAMGSYRPTDREVDGPVLQGARIIVDTPSAILEAGELVLGKAEGYVAEPILHLWESDALGPRPGRTVMKSVGAAFYDLAVAAALLEVL